MSRPWCSWARPTSLSSRVCYTGGERPPSEGRGIVTLPAAGHLSRRRAPAELAAVPRRFLTIPQAGKWSSATMLAVVGADYGQRIMAYWIHAPLMGLSYSWPDDAIKLRRRELLLVLVGASR